MKTIKSPILALLFALLSAVSIFAAPSYRVVFNIENLPFKEVTDLLYDSDGLLWIATRNGLYCYDSYRLRPYRSDGHHLGLLSDNEVKRIAEDQQHRLWIATAQGLDRLDKHTGIIEHITPENVKTSTIREMMVARNNHLWIASYSGFYDYDPVSDTFSKVHIPDQRGNELSVLGESVMEDHRGFMWLGTGNHGLYRFDPKTKELVHYPQLNSRNSAHVLLEDQEKRIWVAGWGCGIQVLQNAWDVNHVTWQSYKTPDLIGDYTYSMTLDTDHHQVMIGSSSGMTLASTNQLGQFTKLVDKDNLHAIPGVEITGIERSVDGRFWVSMIGDGVMAIEPEGERFGHSTFGDTFRNAKTTSVRSIFADSRNRLWMGIGTQGLAVQELKTGKIYNWNEIPAFASAMPSMSTVYAIRETYDHHIWVATYGDKLMDITPPAENEDIRKLKVSIYYATKDSIAPSENIFSLFEDSQDNLWIFGDRGIVRRSPDGSIQHFDSLQVEPGRNMSNLEGRQILQDKEGAYWLAAIHNGIYRMKPQGDQWQVDSYNLSNGGIADNEIQALCIDHYGHLWAGSNYGDLYYLDTQTNHFVSVKERWHLPGGSVVFIFEDERQNNPNEQKSVLWVGTNEGLLQIVVGKDISTAHVTHYTVDDGLLDNHLIRNAVTQDNNGNIYFGTYQGYNFFRGNELAELEEQPQRISMSELLIDDTPWLELPEKERFEISAMTPRYTHEISLSHKHNSFTMEFVETGELNKQEGNFAYRLKGYDKEWRYTWGNLPRVYYSNLPAGSYTFQIFSLKSSTTEESATPEDESQMLQIKVRILPAWYATLWAKIIYVILSILALFLIYRGAKTMNVYWRRLLLRARDRAAIRKGAIIIKTAKPEITNVDKDFIQRAIQCINTHISDFDYDQQRFLEDMGVSKATCFRKLKSLTGQSYINFVRDIKMKAAMKIQKENPNIRISDLAYAVGYSDPKYFSQCYKKYQEEIKKIE